MGKIFSKRKNLGTNKLTARFRRPGRSNPHNVGSTQSLDFSGLDMSPNPNRDEYRNVGSTQSLNLPGMGISPHSNRSEYRNVGSTQNPNLSEYRNVGSTQNPNLSGLGMSPYDNSTEYRNVGSTQNTNMSGLDIAPYDNSTEYRNVGSTQNTNMVGPGMSPNPLRDEDDEFYDEFYEAQPEYQTFADEPAAVQPQSSLPPALPARSQGNRSKFQSQSSSNLQNETAPTLPPRNLPPPASNSYSEIRRNVANERSDSDNFYDAPNSDSRQRVRADKNYEANFDSDISFRKGDILQLFEEGETDGWYFARNLTTDKEGFVPKDWVTSIGPTPSNDVESQQCFFKGLDRVAAEQKLSEPELETGTYLLRSSGDGYALSLRCLTDSYEVEIRHYKIRVADRGICHIDADSSGRSFSDITALIKHYTERLALRCKLKTPLTPDAFPLIDLHVDEELVVKLSDLTLGEKLGSGNYGSVYAGTLNGNKPVAVKSLKETGLMSIDEFRKEAEPMHKLLHWNLVRLLGICEDGRKFLIITERMSKGALLTLLREDPDRTVKNKDLMEMAMQVVDGMCYLEMKCFVHRDLRAANVLVGDGNVTKIADFGLSRLLDNYYRHIDFYQKEKESAFPYKWTAPEAINDLRFSVKSDVWSFGVLLYEMITHGEEPYAGMTGAMVLDWVENGNRLKRPADCPMALYNIMKECWLMNPIERPSFFDIKDTLVEFITIA